MTLAGKNRADAVQAAYEKVRDYMDEETERLSIPEYAKFLDKLGNDIEFRAEAAKAEQQKGNHDQHH